jgi:hypothetical protein
LVTIIDYLYVDCGGSRTLKTTSLIVFGVHIVNWDCVLDMLDLELPVYNLLLLG